MPHFQFLDVICRIRRGILNEPFGGLVVYLDGDFLQAKGYYEQLRKYNSTYKMPLFSSETFLKNFHTVYFPEEFNKRFKTVEHRNFIMDLRLGRNLTENHVQYLNANSGGNISNKEEIREAMNIVNGLLMLENTKMIFAEKGDDSDVVTHRIRVCKDAVHRSGANRYYRFPIGILQGVSLMCTERKQQYAYSLTYRRYLESLGNSATTFVSKTEVVFFNKNHVKMASRECSSDMLFRMRRELEGFADVEKQLPEESIIIKEGLDYCICVNSKADKLYRHDTVKVSKIDVQKGQVNILIIIATSYTSLKCFLLLYYK